MNPNNAEISLISKESIAVAAAELMKSPNALSVTGVCATAGVSRNAFYRNFETMDDVLIYYMVLRWAEYSREHDVENGPQDKINAHLIRFFYEHRDFIRALKKHHQLYLVESLFKRVIIPLDAEGPMRYFLYGTAYMIYGFIRAMIDNDFADSPDSIETMFEKK
ncbi:MAG: TetR/AcrR family transcriptional regulator [Erysipelotrichaceae bacterium]|nr:TetR/AcrR family transcriptional regulator [Erysipelotrichaceae bacterium]